MEKGEKNVLNREAIQLIAPRWFSRHPMEVRRGEEQGCGRGDGKKHEFRDESE